MAIIVPPVRAKNCIICSEEVVKPLKINGIGSSLERISVESLCMLFGLSGNHRFLTGELAGREVGQLLCDKGEVCNRCREDVSNVQYIFWQLSSLERKLIELQGLLFERLRGNYEAVEVAGMIVGLEKGEVGEDGGMKMKGEGEVENDVVIKSLFEEIQFWKESWPTTSAYSSRWKEAQECSRKHFESQVVKQDIVVKPQSSEVNVNLEQFDSVVVKEETVDFHLNDEPEKMELEGEQGFHQDDDQLDDDDDDYVMEMEDPLDTDSDWDYESELKTTKNQSQQPQRKRLKKSSGKTKKKKGKGSKSAKSPGTSQGDQVLFIHLCTYDPDICNRTYTRKKDLTKHIKEFHEGRTHVCDYEGCVEKFLSEPKLIYHKRRAHNFESDRRFPCEVDPGHCSKAYRRKSDLKEHIRDFHHGKTFNCEHEGCTEKFLKESRLIAHRIKAHGYARKARVEQFRICEICGIPVRTNRWSEHHRRVHLGQEKFSCARCSMNFDQSDELKAHEELHDQVSQTLPYTCVLPECQKVFSNSIDLKNHVIKYHLTDWLKCDVCGVIKPNDYLLQKHKISHERSQERNFVCDQCPKAYFTESALNEHKRDYHMGRSFTCDICGKEYSLVKSFKRHMRAHEEDKPYKCSICPKAFHFAQALQRHETVHSGTKYYSCQLCGKSFKQEQNLKQHLNTQQHKGQVKPKLVKPVSAVEGIKIDELVGVT